MFRHLVLTRPLAVIDLETTGIDVKKDRIVEISVLKIWPDGTRKHHTRLLNPTIPIPEEATAFHGFTDADVANEKTFVQIADGLERFLNGCDLCGFNLRRYDMRLLYAEFKRAGIDWNLEGRSIVDPLEIYHHYEKRDLTSAVKFYLNRDHEGAHGAMADVLATEALIDAMLEKYAKLPRNVENLSQFFTDPNKVDFEGKFKSINGVVQFTFGKCRGQPLTAVAANDRRYLEDFLLNAPDFPEDAKDIIRLALEQVQSVPSRGVG